jgi:hypothetical protein
MSVHVYSAGGVAAEAAGGVAAEAAEIGGPGTAAHAVSKEQATIVISGFMMIGPHGQPADFALIYAVAPSNLCLQYMKSAEAAAASLSMEFLAMPVRSDDEIKGRQGARGKNLNRPATRFSHHLSFRASSTPTRSRTRSRAASRMGCSATLERRSTAAMSHSTGSPLSCRCRCLF